MCVSNRFQGVFVFFLNGKSVHCFFSILGGFEGDSHGIKRLVLESYGCVALIGVI